MALQKSVISVPFTKGVDLKSDPKQLLQGSLLLLQNGVFTSPGRIMKRFGYGALNQVIQGTTTKIPSGAGLANFKNELLLMTGTEGYSYSDSTTRWTDKQTITNLELTSTEITRNTYQQTSPDVAIHPSGLEVVAYEDSRGGSRYTLIDTITGEQVISDLLISTTAIKPKTFVLGNFLLILYVDTSDNHLRAIPIPIVTPTSPLATIDIATNLNPTYPNYDGALYSNYLYVSYYTASGIFITSLNQFLQGGSPVGVTGEVASSCINTAVDQTQGNIWTTYHNGTELKYFIFTNMLPLTPLLGPTNISANSNTILNISLLVSNNTGTVFYTQTASLPSNNFILQATITSTGTVSGNKVFVRSVSIAGKSFTYNGLGYITVAFDSVLQPTYFTLRTIDNAVVAKFSPGVGGGTLVRNIVPEACPVESGIYIMGSLVKDLLTTISGTVYTQTGVNVIELDFIDPEPVSVELGANTHITGGILNQYDGVSIVEHGFNIYPENVSVSPSDAPGGLAPGTYQYFVVYSWMDGQGQINYSAPSTAVTNVISSTETPINFTGDLYGGLTTINVSSTAGLSVGQVVTDTSTPGNLSYGTTITGIGAGFITISPAVPGSVTLPVTDNLTVLNPSLSTFKAVFTSGETTFPVSSTSGLYVGQPISDLTTSGNLAAHTFITAVGSSDITINTATLGNSASTPGDTMQTTAPGTLLTHAVFSSGVTNINVSSTANLFVGQVITDVTTSGNFSANTTITAINTGTNTVTINQPTLGASASSPGDIIQTADGFSATLTIPTLRLTQKKPPVRTPVIIQVYRTEDSQTIGYLVSSVTAPLLNDVTVDSVTFIDTLNDAAIIGNPTLYTTGGVIENIAAPSFNYITTYQDTIIGLPAENKNQFWISKQNVAGAPVEFTDSFVFNVDQAGGDLVACLKMDSELVFWRETQIYYITGVGPDATGNQNNLSAPINIASDVGCSDKKSLVIFPGGIIFKSLKGMYLLARGLALSYIGAPVEAYNANHVVSAQLIENTQQIRFVLDNGVALVYDYYVQQWSVFTNIPGVDSAIFQDEFTYLTASGMVLQETPGQYTDNGEFIQLALTTGWLSFNQLQGFQRVYKMLFLGDYFNPHNVSVFAAYDFNPFAIQQNVTMMKPIFSSNNYGNDPTYGYTTPFGGPPQTYQFRVDFNRQKCEAIQITIQDQQLGASFGENLALSAFAFEVGAKYGVDKLVAAGTNTNTP